MRTSHLVIYFRLVLAIFALVVLCPDTAFAHHRHHYGHVSRHRAYTRAISRRSGLRADQASTSRSVIATRDPAAFRTPVTEVRGMWVTRFSLTSPGTSTKRSRDCQTIRFQHALRSGSRSR